MARWGKNVQHQQMKLILFFAFGTVVIECTKKSPSRSRIHDLLQHTSAILKLSFNNVICEFC
jgi:hypothetical protein